MIMRLLALTLAAAMALLAFEFFFQSLRFGASYFNMHTVLLHTVLPGTAGIVLAAVAMSRLRRKRLPAAPQGREKPENSR